MISQLVIKTPSGDVPLGMEFLPTGLFADEISPAIERNQDSNTTLNFSDNLPKPRVLSVEATKRFSTASERDEYLRSLRETLEQFEGLVYAGEIGFFVDSAWLDVSYSPSRVLDVELTIRFAPTQADFYAYLLDGVYLFRDDIMLSRTDITLETLRSD